jgi:CheY-like chemotaxis protein
LEMIKSTAAKAPHKPLKILVAEDNPTNQLVVCLLLKKLGYTADVVGDGRAAVEALERQRYDVILMDAHMPTLDGMEATQEIHRRWGQERPKIIAVTASAGAVYRQRCLAAGMDELIGKPILPQELETVLRLCGDGRTPEVVAQEPKPQSLDELPEMDPLVLNRLGGWGSEDVKALINSFLESCKDAVAQIRSAVTHGDARGLAEAAHSLKGGCSLLGARRLEAVSSALEQRGSEGRTVGGEKDLAMLERELEGVRQAMARGINPQK